MSRPVGFADRRSAGSAPGHGHTHRRFSPHRGTSHIRAAQWDWPARSASRPARCRPPRLHSWSSRCPPLSAASRRACSLCIVSAASSTSARTPGSTDSGTTRCSDTQPGGNPCRVSTCTLALGELASGAAPVDSSTARQPLATALLKALSATPGIAAASTQRIPSTMTQRTASMRAGSRRCRRGLTIRSNTSGLMRRTTRRTGLLA
ncbi:protein of unknown function [Thiomonas sp. CB3]|nr:protein of unknown function [Thiomonas sp. CB3]